MQINRSKYAYRGFLAGSIFVFIFLVVGSYTLTHTPTTVSAGDVHLGTQNLINPKPPSVRKYDAGSPVELRVNFSFHYCANSWANAQGRMSRPVPYGTAHAGYGGWSQGSHVSTRNTGHSNDQYRTFYNSQYSQVFAAPTRSGKYWFRYQVGVSNGQNTDRYFEGVAVFEILPADLCTNLNGTHETVPRGYFQTISTNGKPICLESSSRNIICSASKNPVVPNEHVTFSARTSSGSAANFSWYNGPTTQGSVVKQDDNVTTSQFSRSFAQEGIHFVSTLVESNGTFDRCFVGVTVRDPNNDAADIAIYIDGGRVGADDASRIFITDDGEIFILNPNAAAADIQFAFQRGITNDTCVAEWNAQNVLRCDLYRNGALLRPIEKTGTADLTPGSYQIKCLQERDGSEVSSDIAICRQNPDLREI